jgi:hypothetical protein
MSGWVILLVGLVLCFLGVGSIHLAVLASGFGLGWLLADLFHADAWTSLLVALGSAVIGWVLVTLVFKFASFFVGMITGALIGARLYSILTPGEASIVLAAVVVVAVAIVFGFLADRYRKRVLLWATAIGGAGLVLSSLGLIWPQDLGFLRDPQAGVEQVTSTLLWVALSAGGWLTQRRLFPKALRIQERAGRE